jgi:hypothetical protein
MYSNSFGGSSSSVTMGECQTAAGSGALRWPPPAWKFGLRQSDDRGSI